MFEGLKEEEYNSASMMDKAYETKDRVMKFANSASNIATAIEQNVNYADNAIKLPSQIPSDIDMSSGIDSDGEICGRDAIRRPYF